MKTLSHKSPSQEGLFALRRLASQVIQISSGLFGSFTVLTGTQWV